MNKLLPPFSPIFLLVLLLANPAVAAISELTLSSNRTVSIEAEYEPLSNEWIVFLPGSGCGLYNLKDSLWLNTLRSHENYNVMVINKGGITAANDCLNDEYEDGSLRHHRIDDVREVMNNHIPEGASILLMGFSEGGYIAPDIAVANEDVQGLILMSGGTQSFIEEEIMLAPPGERESLRHFFETEVIGSADTGKFYNGLSYAVLSSYHNRNGYEALLGLDIPVLVLHGEKDNLVWLEGNLHDFQDLIESKGKQNITHHLLENGNHGLFCDDDGHSSLCEKRPTQEVACELILNFSKGLR